MKDSSLIHIHHCCAMSCKYGEDTCPVVLGTHKGLYQCEFCDCLEFNPGSDVKADEWWKNLSPKNKAAVYIRNNR